MLITNTSMPTSNTKEILLANEVLVAMSPVIYITTTENREIYAIK